jgi:hypothetical protein
MSATIEMKNNVESRHAISDLKGQDYVFVYENAVDRIRAFRSAMQLHFDNMVKSDAETKTFGNRFDETKKDFEAHRLDLKAFNLIADEYYYDYYYAPELFASALVQSSMDVIAWLTKNLLRFKSGETQFGIEINFDGEPTAGGVGFGNVLAALRHHSAHFEEWVDMATPSKNAKWSWDVLSRFGYTLPLGNTSVLNDAVRRISHNNFDLYSSRLRGAALDLCVEAEIAGVACLTPEQLRDRHQR